MKIKQLLATVCSLAVLCAALPFAAASDGPPADTAQTTSAEAAGNSFPQPPETVTHKLLPPASLAKIMTALLVLEAVDEGKIKLDDMVSASENACNMGGVEIWLTPGEQMSVQDLLIAILIGSGNDAAVALAEHVSGSEEVFVAQMNQKAKQLGMDDTNFLDASGYNTAAQTSAYDVALMSRELLRHEQASGFATIWMHDLRGGATQLVNTNRLIRFYDGATGLKTGTTDAAGHCLCATATRDGLSLISVIMGCKSSDARFEESRQLLDYGFAGFTLYQPQLPQDRLHPVAVKQGMQTQVEPQVEALPQAVVRKNEVDGIEIKLELSEQLQAPVAKGQAIGWIQLVQNGSIIAQQPVTAGQEVQQLTYAKSLRLLAKGLIGMNGQSVCEQVE